CARDAIREGRSELQFQGSSESGFVEAMSLWGDDDRILDRPVVLYRQLEIDFGCEALFERLFRIDRRLVVSQLGRNDAWSLVGGLLNGHARSLCRSRCLCLGPCIRCRSWRLRPGRTRTTERHSGQQGESLGPTAPRRAQG